MTSYRNIFQPDKKIDSIQMEFFYENKHGVILWKKIVVLMKQPLTKSKIKGLLLTSPPDGGKSTLIQQFDYEYTKNVIDAQEDDIIIFNVPQGVGAVQVFAQLCRILGIPDIPINPRNHPITTFVLKAAAKLRLKHKLLIVDELQNLYEIQGLQRKKVLSSFNQLINASRIPIVLVGVSGVDGLLNNIEDDQSDLRGTFSSRFSEFSLQKYTDDDEFKGLLVSMCEDFYLHPNEGSKPFYQDYDIREFILELSEGLWGRIITLIKESALKIYSEELPVEITKDLLKIVAKELKFPNIAHLLD